jgi:hypothetical protein
MQTFSFSNLPIVKPLRLLEALYRAVPDWDSSVDTLTTGWNGVQGEAQVIVRDTVSASYVQAAVSGHGQLQVSASPDSAIQANGEDEVICTIPGMTYFDYVIRKFDKAENEFIPILSGSVNDGALEFSTDVKGMYEIEIINGGDTGYITVEAV